MVSKNIKNSNYLILVLLEKQTVLQSNSFKIIKEAKNINLEINFINRYYDDNLTHSTEHKEIIIQDAIFANKNNLFDLIAITLEENRKDKFSFNEL